VLNRTLSRTDISANNFETLTAFALKKWTIKQTKTTPSNSLGTNLYCWRIFERKTNLTMTFRAIFMLKFQAKPTIAPEVAQSQPKYYSGYDIQPITSCHASKCACVTGRPRNLGRFCGLSQSIRFLPLTGLPDYSGYEIVNKRPL